MSHKNFPTENPAVMMYGLPHANGDLHTDHLRTYVGGDIYSRSLRTLSQQAAFINRSDMHGTPVTVSAEKGGATPEEFAFRYHEKYKAAFPRFNIEFDNYDHTHDEVNTELAREAVRALETEGYIYEKEIPVACDPDTNQWLPDRFVEGACPYCGTHIRGDECDGGCDRHLESGEVEDPVSTLTGNPTEYREHEHKFFAVSDLQDYLQEFIDRLEGTSSARSQPRKWIEGELQDWCTIHDMDWGIDYPSVFEPTEDSGADQAESGRDEGGGSDGSSSPSGTSDLVLYVWVGAPVEYVSSIEQHAEHVGADTFDWGVVQKDAGDTVHVIGRDIIQHHIVFWPTIPHGAGYAEPHAVMASSFITLSDKGFSIPRNRTVWADEYLDKGFHPDLLRYYLATNGGFQQDVDSSWPKFKDCVNSELVGTVGNFLYRSTLFMYRNFEGTPDVSELHPEASEMGSRTAGVSEEVETRIEEAIDELEVGISDYSIRRSDNVAVRLVQFGNEYIRRNEPWKLTDEDPEATAQVIRGCIQITEAITVLFFSVVPGKMQTPWEQLGEDGSVADTGIDDTPEALPASLSESEVLFERIEDERVRELNGEPETCAAETESESDESGENAEEDMDANTDADAGTDLEPVADDRISFEEPQELDVRAGEIVAIGGIDGADKLAKLTIGIGVEECQIVAGIKQLHGLDSFIGSKAIIVVNLGKAGLFGVEPNGMLLAAGDEADILTIHGDTVPGTKVQQTAAPTRCAVDRNPIFSTHHATANTTLVAGADHSA